MKKQSIKKKSAKKISAEEFDRRFDAGEDMSDYLDLSRAKVRRPKIKKVNLDLPEWIVKRLDEESDRRGIARQALIKHWIVDRLDEQEQQATKKAG